MSILGPAPRRRRRDVAEEEMTATQFKNGILEDKSGYDPDFALRDRLKELAVNVIRRDANTILLEKVPVNQKYFNKTHTNVLIKKRPFVLCLDEDLKYRGSDSALTHAFALSVRHNGWRVFFVGQPARLDFSGAVSQALEMLGIDGAIPALSPVSCTPPASDSAGLLAKYGCNLSRQMMTGGSPVCIGRTALLEQILSSLLRWQSNLTVITGDTGAGKTNLIHGIAPKLQKMGSPTEVHLLDLGILMAGTVFDGDRERLLTSLLEEALASPDALLAMEHLEQAILGVPRGPLLLADALDAGARLVGTCSGGDFPWLHREPLLRRTHLVELAQMCAPETLEVLVAIHAQLADYHGIEIDSSMLEIVLQRSVDLIGVQPAKALSLLDAGGAYARFSGARELLPEHIYLAAANLRDDIPGGL